jgi:hypothetical protein
MDLATGHGARTCRGAPPAARDEHSSAPGRRARRRPRHGLLSRPRFRDKEHRALGSDPLRGEPFRNESQNSRLGRQASASGPPCQASARDDARVPYPDRHRLLHAEVSGRAPPRWSCSRGSSRAAVTGVEAETPLSWDCDTGVPRRGQCRDRISFAPETDVCQPANVNTCRLVLRVSLVTSVPRAPCRRRSRPPRPACRFGRCVPDPRSGR